MNKTGLYIHIPFCHKICSYCDFVKRVSTIDTIEKYIDTLIKEIELYHEKGFDFSKIETIYIGGGTPSILNCTNFQKLFDKIFNYVQKNKIQEFTVEFNPEDLNNELIDLLVSYNVNRISIGVQTFNEKLLKLLNRSFDIELFFKRFEYLKTKINNINIDLMYAIPNQTLDDLEETVLKVKELKPTHLSLYSLILEPNTVFNYLLKEKKIELCKEELELQMVDKINKLLFPIFNKYEVSNYCLKNYESKHNLIYWQNNQYLGIGLSSASYLEKYRYNNTSSLKEYFERVNAGELPIQNIEELSIEDEKKYHIILGFRLVEGINLDEYCQRYKSDIFMDFPKLIEFVNEGYMEISSKRIFINQKYFYVMNHLLKQLI